MLESQPLLQPLPLPLIWIAAAILFTAQTRKPCAGTAQERKGIKQNT